MRSSAERLFLVILFLLVFLMAARMPIDTDMWWHLRAGEATWQGGSPLLADPFSFTHPGEEWVNHSWLGQVLLYGAFRVLGYWGVSLLVALAAACSLTLLFLRGVSPAPFRAFLIIFGGIAMSPVWSPRPQVFSLLFLAITIIVLEIYQERGWRRMWLLPLLFMLWSNIHAGYSLGLIYLGCVVFGETLDQLLLGRERKAGSWAQILRLCGWTTICGLVVLFNPNGINVWLVQFNTVGVGALQQFVVEWASPDFHDLMQQPFLWILLLTIFSLGMSVVRPEGKLVVAVIIFAGLALMARRHIGPFVIVVLPALERYGWPLARTFWERLEEIRAFKKMPSLKDRESTLSQPETMRGAKVINLLIVSLLAASAIIKLYIVAFPAYVNTTLKEYFPVDAVEILLESPLGGNLLNEYNWGGYLIWHSRNTPVFIDGRTDLYGDETIGEWADLIQAQGDWSKQLERYKINFVLLKPERLLAAHLGENGWRQLYADEQAVLFARR
ncbi:MAG: hypothetical protein IT308_12065 [Anaerolineaceae bacterium]|nr:hypothetical protein [Anaerolineaceae bacterium]